MSATEGNGHKLGLRERESEVTEGGNASGGGGRGDMCKERLSIFQAHAYNQSKLNLTELPRSLLIRVCFYEDLHFDI